MSEKVQGEIYFHTLLKARRKMMGATLENVAKGICSVSGMGLMIGVETERPAKEIVNACIERGVLCLTAKNKVRFLPALNIPMDLLEQAIETFLAVCAE